MPRNNLPAAPEGRPCAGVRYDLSPKALDRWNPGIKAATDEENTISVFDVIGQDYWTGEGVTAKRIAAALRSMDGKDVTVNVNSPGGDMFEGLAIYNLLRQHKGDVTVRVLGVAASAASIIAMAGDRVEVARAGFLMIHNCWVIAVGNRHDFREVADTMEPFDQAMADIYAARTGDTLESIQSLMDAETWIGGADAVSQGFADSLLSSDEIAQAEQTASAAAVRRMEAALRSSGMPRSEAMRLISDFKTSLRDAAGGGGRDATERGLSDSAASEAAALAASLIKSM
jgi:ATP-dependent Clp protease protease subunit